MKHPLSVIGLAVFVGSWGVLLFGIGSDSHREIINFHKLFMALSGVISGVGMTIAGILVDRFAVEMVDHEGATLSGRLPSAVPIMTHEDRHKLAEELRRSLSETKARTQSGNDFNGN
jgi:hypothetical protein